MSERLALKDILELLPRMPEFDELRTGLLYASVDESPHPNDAREYATLDTRLVPATRIGRLLMNAEQASRKRLGSLYDAATIALSGIGSADAAERVQQLVALGEAAETEERWRDALAYYSLGERLAAMTGHSPVLLRRRLGRAHLNVGRVHEAVACYHGSLADAAAAGDREGQVIAATGLGNVASWAGRWSEADAWYEHALRMSETAGEVRAQLLINRAMVANEQDAPDRAEPWLAAAYADWDVLSPTTRAGWWNIRGLVWLRRERFPDAADAFREGLAVATSAFQRAMLLDNLAETALRTGDFPGARTHTREAEEIALRHGSARLLAEIYLRLGRCCALQADINGVAFFEKALALIGDGQYPLLLARLCREYADFRSRLGERLAARALLLQALKLFNELGALEPAAEIAALLGDTEA